MQKVFGLFDKNIDFSTESAKKPIDDLPFFIWIYSTKNDNKHHSEVIS